MRITIVSLLLLLSVCLSAQVVVNDVNINDLEGIEYVELLATQKLFSSQIIVSIDYGQRMKFGVASTIKGPDGKNQSFNSVINALNFMVANGWEYVESYVITVSNQNVLHYLLRRVSDE